MPGKPTPDFLAILEVLTRHQVDFIVVGGVCAVLQGAPVSTFDLDIVHSREAENIQRLLAALEALDAHYRIQPQRKARPDVSHLSSPGHQLLMTRYGPLDLLGSIGKSRGYGDLFEHTEVVALAKDIEVRILSLKVLIQVKEETAGEKDKAVLHILRRTLEEKTTLQ